MERSGESPPVLKEQAILETYFQCLSKLAHDRAKDIIEREREAAKNRASLLWSSTLHLLTTLATSEKEFFSLVFLSPNLGSRILGRKDALRTTYGCLLTELRKIESINKTVASKTGTGGGELGIDLEQLLGQLSGQLQHYIVARINTIAFYEQVLAASSKVQGSLRELLATISNIGQSCQTSIQHPILSCLKDAFDMECGSLVHLLTAQRCIQHLQFLPALRSLYDAHLKLALWASNIGLKEVKKMSFVSASSKTSAPELYEWMARFKSLLVAKFSLVFYEILSQQGPHNEIKSLQSKTYIDFYGRIVAFLRKSDAVSVSLILNRSDFGGLFPGLGYQLPKTEDSDSSLLSEHDDSLFVFSHPPEKPDKHWPALLALVTRKAQELNSDRLVAYYDEKFQSSYFLIRVDPGIILVVIYEAKKQDRDNYITNFLQTTANDLRCSKIYSMLKPGTKS